MACKQNYEQPQKKWHMPSTWQTSPWYIGRKEAYYIPIQGAGAGTSVRDKESRGIRQRKDSLHYMRL